jgi:hypothetical protein
MTGIVCSVVKLKMCINFIWFLQKHDIVTHSRCGSVLLCFGALSFIVVPLGRVCAIFFTAPSSHVACLCAGCHLPRCGSNWSAWRVACNVFYLFTSSFGFSRRGMWHPPAGAPAPATALAAACAVIRRGDQNSPFREIGTCSAVLILFPHVLHLLASLPLISYDSRRRGPLLLILQIWPTGAPVFLLPPRHCRLARLLFNLHCWNGFQQEAKPTMKRRRRCCSRSPQWFLPAEIWWGPRVV